VVIPAANIALSRTPIAGISIQNQIPGTVIDIRIVNHRALVSVDTGTTLIAEISAKALHDLELRINDQVYCLIKAQAIRHLGKNDLAV
jgi:molybdate transport system ATP-binding protein